MSYLSDFLCKINPNCEDKNLAQLEAQENIAEQQIAQQQLEAELKSKVQLERTKTIGKVVIIVVIVVVVFLLIKKFTK